MEPSSDIAFTPTVKQLQQRHGSRAAYARMEASGGWETTVTPELADFLAEQTSWFLATANAEGQPYIQHRGGPVGFLRVLDDHTLGFADFAGNRQYITAGNLSENAKVCLFLVDYLHKRRIKIWGTATVVEDDPELLAKLAVPGYAGKPERAIMIHIEAWDTNCPKHIPQLVPAVDVAKLIAARDARIAELEAELLKLRG
jgi:predicted pyridoxine 5'-phosphate oxidase superfamily flavin-nucleotide-binding protein